MGYECQPTIKKEQKQQPEERPPYFLHKVTGREHFWVRLGAGVERNRGHHRSPSQVTIRAQRKTPADGKKAISSSRTNQLPVVVLAGKCNIPPF